MPRITRKKETQLVKDALAAAGINARVGHGQGTAYGWIEINVGSGAQFPEHKFDEQGFHIIPCPGCVRIMGIGDRAREIAREIRLQNGGNPDSICVLTQKHWDRLHKIEIEILQPIAAEHPAPPSRDALIEQRISELRGQDGTRYLPAGTTDIEKMLADATVIIDQLMPRLGAFDSADIAFVRDALILPCLRAEVGRRMPQ